MNENERSAATCCICGMEITTPAPMGRNNPWPIIRDGKSVCCDRCNGYADADGYHPGYVIAVRMAANNHAALQALADLMEGGGCTAESVAGVRELARAKYVDLMAREVILS